MDIGIAFRSAFPLVLLLSAAHCGPSSTSIFEVGGPCDSGETAECYTGPDGTLDVGLCSAGTATCGADGIWGQCENQILPGWENCADGQDNNCNGEIDEDTDLDGDGYSSCQGDCCESPAQGCASPQLVNPGAFDSMGNGIDDDCDGTADNGEAVCDVGLASNSSDPEDYARAMDLCSPPVDIDNFANRWGLISAEILLPDGSAGAAANSRSIRPGYGTGTPALSGLALAMLSTGHAAAPGDTAPAHSDDESMGTFSDFPADRLAANGGSLPNVAGCPGTEIPTAFDGIMLRLTIQVPTNARSFSFKSNFFSTEYPEWVCTTFNDFFVVLLDSGFASEPANPDDKNLARYTADDDTTYPIGVNLATNDTGLFRQCVNGEIGCLGVPSENTSCTGTENLAGTGMDTPDPGTCDADSLTGGATGWLTTAGNVVPGEIITLRIAIWDTGDDAFDSVVVLDEFRWSTTTTAPGTTID